MPVALTESQNSGRQAWAPLAGLTGPCPQLAQRFRRPLARAENCRRGLSDPRVQRRPDLPVADPARPLDGQLRVRHLRLCLDPGVGDRRSVRSRVRHFGTTLRAGICASAARSICCAASSCRAAAGSRSAARLSSRRPASSRSICWSRISRVISCCRSRSRLRRCRVTLGALLLPLVPEQGAFAKALDAVLAREGRAAQLSAAMNARCSRPAHSARDISSARCLRRQAEEAAPPAPAAGGDRAR